MYALLTIRLPIKMEVRNVCFLLSIVWIDVDIIYTKKIMRDISTRIISELLASHKSSSQVKSQVI